MDMLFTTLLMSRGMLCFLLAILVMLFLLYHECTNPSDYSNYEDSYCDI